MHDAGLLVYLVRSADSLSELNNRNADNRSSYTSIDGVYRSNTQTIDDHHQFKMSSQIVYRKVERKHLADKTPKSQSEHEVKSLETSIGN